MGRGGEEVDPERENDRVRRARWRSVRRGCVWIARLALDEIVQHEWRKWFGSDGPGHWL
jgi:hypothetical protein